MKIATIRFKEYYEQASTTEQGIISFVINHPEEVAKMTIYQLAEHTFSSPSSIIRLCKKNGFSGYKEFSKSLLYEQAVRTSYKNKQIADVNKVDSVNEVVDKVTNKNILSLEETSSLLDINVIEDCVKSIHDCEKIVLFGIGASLIVAKDAQLKFTRINKMVYVAEDWHTQLLMAKNMTDNDIGIVISYSGETEEMIQCAKTAKENQAKLISITKYGSATISGISDYNLFVAANEYVFRSGAMSSRISQLNLVDILYTSYMNIQYEESIAILEKNQIRKGSNLND
ncbi:MULTISPECIES: MurR/RpiR family transcriptional regulator [Virgibacillus]|uniref:MurR/RpiR family transcriptional regulator n=1 Tax=Virgibacillus salarius TaxID=447199 RepID=A0A941DV21_9BACI|nr:MurR/RpiR family transcriptional regulator [Virgibacillus sp. Bac332]MBR7795882.1 MurR/RpiR family transcriptional regulator [Virgibacillus salarius]NAZ08594.1 SIS domain-containing protein [Agaribacter marinus]